MANFGDACSRLIDRTDVSEARIGRAAVPNLDAARECARIPAGTAVNAGRSPCRPACEPLPEIRPSAALLAQRTQDLTVGNREPASTLADHATQFVLQRGKLRDLGLHLREMRTGQRVDLGTGTCGIVGERHELAHFLKREAQVAGAAHK